MEYNVDRELRLNTNPKYKNLYQWAIYEVDRTGKQVTEDLVPWGWPLHFSATSCALFEATEQGDETVFDGDQTEGMPINKKLKKSRKILAQLIPHARTGMYWPKGRSTEYSMFGTSRMIKEFLLEIHPLDDPSTKERHMALGIVSWTDPEFPEVNHGDLLQFYVMLDQSDFDLLARRVSSGEVDDMFLIVGSVEGFYSRWEPEDTTTDFIKVLARDKTAQVLPALSGSTAQPWRLGKIGNVELRVNRRLEIGRRELPIEDEDCHLPEVRESPISMPHQEAAIAPPQPESKHLKLLQSLSRAMWWVVILLVLILARLLWTS
jgi:hypothetical protein